MTTFAYDDQMRSQPAAVEAVLDATPVPRLDPGRRLVLSGIGTSLHACRVASYWAAELSGGRLQVPALEAHELALHGRWEPGDQLVVVSHRGTKRFPNELLARAREAGATTVLITGLGPEDPPGTQVLRTCADERAGTHTVSYLSALAVLARLVSRALGDPSPGFLDALARVPEALRETLAMKIPAELAGKLSGRGPVLITGFGIDAVTAEEAALKLKEGAYLWAEGMSEELALHGTPAVLDARSAAIILQPGREDGGRAPQLQALLEELGLLVLTCGPEPGADLGFATVDYLLRPFVAIVPLQRLVGELARVRGSNPDTIRAEESPWREALVRVRL